MSSSVIASIFAVMRPIVGNRFGKRNRFGAGNGSHDI
jgi:hypothetical protein